MDYLHSLETLIISFILLAVASKAFTQSVQTEVKIIRKAFGLGKKLAIANFMDLKEPVEGFWTIYDEYEALRKKLENERIQIISEYTQSYLKIYDEKIVELFNRTQTVKKSFDQLLKTNFKKMKKEDVFQKVVQFRQIELYLSSLIQANIYSRIPFIG